MPKPPPTLRRDAAHLRLRDSEHERRHQQAHDVRRLRAHPDGVGAGAGVVVGGGAARLHRRRDQPLVDEPLPHDDVGLARPRSVAVEVAARPVHDDVAGGVLVDLRRAVGGRAPRRRRRRRAAPSRPRSARARPRRPRGVSATTAATPAPVKATLSISSARGVTMWFSAPAACQAHGSGLRCSKSCPVKTPTTPGRRGGA